MKKRDRLDAKSAGARASHSRPMPRAARAL
jgi:hypothetical protein